MSGLSWVFFFELFFLQKVFQIILHHLFNCLAGLGLLRLQLSLALSQIFQTGLHSMGGEDFLDFQKDFLECFDFLLVLKLQLEDSIV